MKQPWWQSYTRFSTFERRGITALLVLCSLLLILNFTVHLFIPEDKTSDSEEQQLLLAWRQYRATHQTATPSATVVAANPAPSTLFPFDPNTLDSTGFIVLGLKPHTTRSLLNWRRKGKVFYKPEDLKPLYSLTPAEYNRLAPNITISTPPPSRNSYASSSLPPLPRIIDLNTTDSATLVRLNGLGPTLTRKIIEKRKALGGFLHHDQLREVYPFPDTTFAMLRQRLGITPQNVRRLSLNSATADHLKAHPYIGEQMARNIILYREGLKQFTSIQQLRQVPLMNEENYRKIAPYFTVE